MNKVCIVGNGGSSLKLNGRFIDSCDIVIRIKGFNLLGYESYIGSKTDIWCTKWFSYQENTLKSTLLKENVKIWLPFIDPENYINDDKFKIINDYIFSTNFTKKNIDLQLHQQLKAEISVSNLQFITEEELKFCFSCLNLNSNLCYTASGINVMHPTTYICAIILALRRFDGCDLYITGFDGFKQGYYWNLTEKKKHEKTWPHEYQREFLYIKKLILTKKITHLI